MPFNASSFNCNTVSEMLRRDVEQSTSQKDRAREHREKEIGGKRTAVFLHPSPHPFSPYIAKRGSPLHSTSIFSNMPQLHTLILWPSVQYMQHTAAAKSIPEEARQVSLLHKQQKKVTFVTSGCTARILKEKIVLCRGTQPDMPDALGHHCSLSSYSLGGTIQCHCIPGGSTRCSCSKREGEG